jgi:hypothetical protein
MQKFIDELNSKWLKMSDGKHAIQLSAREVKLLDLCFPEQSLDEVLAMLRNCDYKSKYAKAIRSFFYPILRGFGFRLVKEKEAAKTLDYRQMIDTRYIHIIPVAVKRDRYFKNEEYL